MEGRGGRIWSTGGRGGWEKEEKEGEAHGRRLGHGHLHAEWKGEKEEKEGEAHGRRAHGRRLGKMDLQRRAHGFAEEEGTWICRGGGHTVLHRRRAHGRRKWFDFFLLSLECAC
jgi:hypothetical protein